MTENEIAKIVFNCALKGIPSKNKGITNTNSNYLLQLSNKDTK